MKFKAKSVASVARRFNRKIESTAEVAENLFVRTLALDVGITPRQVRQVMRVVRESDEVDRGIKAARLRITHDEVWVSKDGTRTEVQDLSEKHARSIIRMILRAKRQAQVTRFERFFMDAFDEGNGDF